MFLYPHVLLDEYLFSVKVSVKPAKSGFTLFSFHKFSWSLRILPKPLGGCYKI